MCEYSSPKLCERSDYMYRSVRNIPKQLLENLYVKEKWTLRDIADYIGCSVDTIVRRMADV